MKLITLLILLLVGIPNTLAQSTEVPSGNASIAGRVLLEGKPLADAIVNLVFGQRVNGPTRTTKTDANGKYKFEGVGAGTYFVAPHAMAYVFSEASNYQPYPGKNVNLSAEEHLTDVNLALTRGGVITGKITDAAGRPVVEERISLILKDAQGRNASRVRNYFEPMISQTDDRGIYRIFGLAPGKYLVSVGEGENNFSGVGDVARKRYPQTFYPGVATETEAKLVEVEADAEAANIDIRLSREKQTYTARGQAVDGLSGKPIVGIRIGLVRIGRNGMQVVASTPGITNANGEFAIQGLISGSYAVYLENEYTLPFYAERTMFEVADADVNGLQIKAQRGSTISGSVLIQGAAAQDLSQLFRSLYVSYFSRAGDPALSYTPMRLQSDGTFRLTGIIPGLGNFRLGSFTGENQVMLLRVERDGVPINGGLTVNAGEEVQGIRLIAGLGAGVIRGQVVVQGGTIPSGAMMMVSARLLSTQQGGRTVSVDARGTFLFEKLMPGEYELMLSPPLVNGQSPPPPANRKTVKQRITVSATGETTVTMTLDLSQQGGQQ